MCEAYDFIDVGDMIGIARRNKYGKYLLYEYEIVKTRLVNAGLKLYTDDPKFSCIEEDVTYQTYRICKEAEFYFSEPFVLTENTKRMAKLWIDFQNGEISKDEFRSGIGQLPEDDKKINLEE